MGFVLNFESLAAWCVRQNFNHRANPELGQVAIAYKILGVETPLMIIPEPARGMVLFAMEMPFRAAPERHMAVYQTIGLLNASSYMGAWVLNSRTGEIYFRVTIPALDIEYTDKGLLHAGRVVVGTCEKVAPGLKAVALEGAAPESAIPKE